LDGSIPATYGKTKKVRICRNVTFVPGICAPGASAGRATRTVRKDVRVELIVGATGYVGGRLLRRLVAEGRPVRVLVRDRSRLAVENGVEIVEGDLASGRGLREALAGATFAYYLAHSMESGRERDFQRIEQLCARNFVAAAQRSGLERCVYLGGIAPRGRRSRHLASRLAVERSLLRGLPGATALRASIVIGAHSASFQVIVRLVERLRVLPLPSWRDRRTAPVDERDVVTCLARTPFTPAAAGRSIDIAAPETVTFGELVLLVAEHLGVGRLPLPVPGEHTPLAAPVVSRITGVPLALVRPLMESLEADIVPRDRKAVEEIYGIRPRPLERAIERALAELEAERPLAAR